VRAGTLFRNETLKLRKRPAMLWTLGMATFVSFMIHWDEFRSARQSPERSFALPEAWADMFGDQASVGLIFGTIALLFLVSSEFSWRTARQNVIDGLSKSEWFVGKTQLLLILPPLFLGIYLTLGGILALLSTDVAAATGPLFGFAQLKAIGGLLLAFLGSATLALAISFAVRSVGGAIAIWFFYIAVGENLLAGMLSQLGEWIRPALRFLPWNAMQSLVEPYYQYDPAAFERAVQAAQQAERAIPELPPTGEYVIAVLAWTAFLLTVSYFGFVRRDL